MEHNDKHAPLGHMTKLGLALQEARGYAMEAFPGIRLDGPLDIDILKRSFLETLSLFPGLRRIMTVPGNGREKRLGWIYTDDRTDAAFEVQDLITTDDTPDSADLAFLQIQQKKLNAPPFDLTKEFGIRAYLFKAGHRRHYVLLRFSHILSDGRGMLIFSGFWARRYNELLLNAEAPLREEPFPAPRNEGIPIFRFLTGLGWRGLARLAMAALRRLKLALRFPPFHIAAYIPDLAGRFRTWEIHLPADRVKVLKARAKAMRHTLNVLALAAGYHTVLRYCTEEGIAAKRVTVNSPHDMRDLDSTAVANLVVARSISLIPERIRDDRHLLETIKRELRDVMVSRLYLLESIGLRLLSTLPYGALVRFMRRAARKGRNPAATLLVSYLGEITRFGPFERFGEAALSRIYHGVRGQYPPGYITPLFSFKGDMILGIGYYEPALTEEKCRRIGRIFFEELERISMV